MIRFLDIFFSLFGLIILLPFLLIIGICIKIESRGNALFKQLRVGKNNKDFHLYKFRSMRIDAEKSGLLTVGQDSRITKIGRFIRKYKIDELPQLFNVLIGDMSLVGPRPEVRKYVDLYNDEQRKILSVRPGITDFASIYYVDENRLLGMSENPEKTYIEEIMPNKIKQNIRFIESPSVSNYFKVILLTIRKIVF